MPLIETFTVTQFPLETKRRGPPCRATHGGRPGLSQGPDATGLGQSLSWVSVGRQGRAGWVQIGELESSQQALGSRAVYLPGPWPWNGFRAS